MTKKNKKTINLYGYLTNSYPPYWNKQPSNLNLLYSYFYKLRIIAGNYLFEVVIVYSGIRQEEMSGKP